MSFANPKGIASFSPRLARQRLPWVRVWNRKQHRRRWVTNQTNRTTSTRLWPFVREWESPQPRCGWDLCWTMTQGSAFRATLGFGTESRWDSPNAQFKNRSSQSSGTRNFGGHGGAYVTCQSLLRPPSSLNRHSDTSPNGAAAQSPRLARTRLPWVNVAKRKQPQRGCGQRRA